MQSGPSTHHHQQSPIRRRIWTLSVCAVTGCSGCGGVTYCAYLALIFIDTHHRSEGGGGGTCLLLVAAWLVTMSALSDPLTPDYKACKPERSWAGVLYTAAGTKGYLARRRRRLCRAVPRDSWGQGRGSLHQASQRDPYLHLPAAAGQCCAEL